MIDSTVNFGPPVYYVNVNVSDKFGIKIAPNILFWDLKKLGIEAWLEINVGPYNDKWYIVDVLGKRIGFANAEDAIAFRLRFGL